MTAPDGSRPDWWWTGRAPVPGCPGLLPDGTMTSLPAPNLATVTRQQLLDYFDNTWTLTEVLFSALQGAKRGGSSGSGAAQQTQQGQQGQAWAPQC